MKWIYSVPLVLLTLAGEPGSAQWSKRLDPAIPHTRAGKLDLAARPPKTRDGKLDFSGVWLPQPDPKGKPEGVENIVVPRYFINIMADLKPEDVPIQPWAMALLKERVDSQGKLSPSSQCKPTGVPAAATVPRMGHPHSSNLHLIERFRRPDAAHLDIDVTIDDPKAYSKVITYTQRQTLIPDEDLYEYFCTENEKDVEHFK